MQQAKPPADADARRQEHADRAAERARQRALRPWYRKRWIVVMVLGLLIILPALAGGDPAADDGAVTGEDDQQQESSAAGQTSDEADAAGDSDVAPAAEEEQQPADVAEPEGEPEPAPPRFREADYSDLTAREFSKITRDPDSHTGEKVLVFGVVFQFDSLTGTDQFLANVDGDRDPEGEEFGFVSYDHNAILIEGERRRAKFNDVVEDDHFAAWVTVAGSFNYDTQIDGSTTATLPKWIASRCSAKSTKRTHCDRGYDGGIERGTFSDGMGGALI